MTTPEGAPRMRCEGSGCPAHGGAMCAMCGEYLICPPDGIAPEHDRIDVLTMLERELS